MYLVLGVYIFCFIYFIFRRMGKLKLIRSPNFYLFVSCANSTLLLFEVVHSRRLFVVHVRDDSTVCARCLALLTANSILLLNMKHIVSYEKNS